MKKAVMAFIVGAILVTAFLILPTDPITDVFVVFLVKVLGIGGYLLLAGGVIILLLLLAMFIPPIRKAVVGWLDKLFGWW